MAAWKSYEEVARFLLDKFAQEFGLRNVEGKQTIDGLDSGTKWEIDGKGIREGNSGFMIIECRRYKKSRQNQGQIAHLAYSIRDTKACGGILVSPLGLQAGAKKVAQAEKIIEVHLRENSTQYEYLLSFLNNVMLGASDNVFLSLTESASIEARDMDGKIVERKGLNAAGFDF